MKNLALVTAFMGVSLLACMAGCSTGDDSGADVRVAGGVETRGPATSICPSYGFPHKPEWYQEKATRVAAYVVGGPDWTIDPETGYQDKAMFDPSTGNEKVECQFARECADYLKRSLLPTLPPRGSKDGSMIPPVAEVTPTVMGDACGLKAGMFSIDWYTLPLPTEIAIVDRCAEHLDGCFDKGVSGFFFVTDPPASTCGSGKGSTIDPKLAAEFDKCLADKKCAEKCLKEPQCADYAKNGGGGGGGFAGKGGGDGQEQCPPAPVMRLMIDPQPAQATASLTGSTGATAAATFVNTGTSTNIIKWTPSYSPGSTAPAGTPCAVTDLGVNEVTPKFIQVFGSNRRCY